ncbi:MAG: ribosome silencing factor [Nitrospirae bacterium]|nr:MAG: ribosome silencing factor [Nitrospirota bacterium]
MTLESKAKALSIARASLEKKAHDVLILSVAKLTSVADYLVLCSGESERQVRAIADYIDSMLATQRVSPLSIEGASTANWILMDFGDVVVHVFRTDIRHHYGLEGARREIGHAPVSADSISGHRGQFYLWVLPRAESRGNQHQDRPDYQR